MKTPKTPIAFDYDLWTTENGKYMVRVKRTGEVSEVDRDVMRVLRAEEKRIRRSYGSDKTAEDEDGAEKFPDRAKLLAGRVLHGNAVPSKGCAFYRCQR